MIQNSCWQTAAGGSRSSVTMPDQLQLDLPLAMFHSTGLFAGGLCCSIHARPFSLAWTTNTDISVNKCEPAEKKTCVILHRNSQTDSPCTIPENISAIEGVDWYILHYFAGVITKHRFPASKQHLVLKGRQYNLYLSSIFQRRHTASHYLLYVSP